MFIDITQTLIYLIKIGIWHVPMLDSDIHGSITGIDLFDQNVGMVCANIRLRCSLISLALIYLIKIGMWHVLKLD